MYSFPFAYNNYNQKYMSSESLLEFCAQRATVFLHHSVSFLSENICLSFILPVMSKEKEYKTVLLYYNYACTIIINCMQRFSNLQFKYVQVLNLIHILKSIYHHQIGVCQLNSIYSEC